ncbi:hypothetical protein ACSAGD_10505 [Paramicrobacterium sp. CJ85]|uniref:hypothetical protein n=1 Tax=Paramicrobacterium sp. CJ85 TaxID=3445355 RepID=UPI003F636984
MATKANTTAALIEAAILDAERTKKWTAEKSAIPTTTFNRKLRGGAEFTIGEVLRVADALSVHPYDLLPREFHIGVAA